MMRVSCSKGLVKGRELMAGGELRAVAARLAWGREDHSVRHVEKTRFSFFAKVSLLICIVHTCSFTFILACMWNFHVVY